MFSPFNFVNFASSHCNAIFFVLSSIFVQTNKQTHKKDLVWGCTECAFFFKAYEFRIFPRAWGNRDVAIEIDVISSILSLGCYARDWLPSNLISPILGSAFLRPRLTSLKSNVSKKVWNRPFLSESMLLEHKSMRISDGISTDKSHLPLPFDKRSNLDFPVRCTTMHLFEPNYWDV